MFRYYVALLLLFLSTQITALEKVTLQLKWTHQFQFAGYYMAKEKGFYHREGLDVHILPADPNNPNVDFRVLYGQAQFGVFHSGLLKQRLNGKPFVALAAVLQSSPYCWMVRADSDIYVPRDFQGKRLSHLGHTENGELLMMLQRAGVNTQNMRLYSGNEPLKDFIAGKFDAMQVYSTNEPYAVQQSGLSTREICPKQFGLNVYADVLFTTESVLENRPELVKRFRRASLKGWRYAMLHLEETLAITKQQYATQKSLEQLAFEAEKLTEFIKVANIPIGTMSTAKWQWIAQLYHLDVSQFHEHKARFIYSEVKNEQPKLSWVLIIAAILTLVCIPMYIHLIFSRKYHQQLR
ncbi:MULTISPECIES: ABC transporter substrate-binding protein [Pseudoalteromonas]|uniref:ABC transporter substrate-binding protein n=1 Tax=Pseudoalteromonas TaxID=53246 RepID=UPI0019D2B24C|nr:MULTISPECIES: ABC transporter substrate-binding protein [Pseudoalteromonas]MBR8842925.1 ABC transporter substrate-binding protein [Pseudoalteromonas sp. JC3]UDM63350.1 ABC transporter substrate-binding protein [Pseudoalteromonas piscicida]WJE10596.1 ABC transporter substrate-binding protein [Pseudoalteromonas sp. JC3]